MTALLETLEMRNIFWEHCGTRLEHWLEQEGKQGERNEEIVARTAGGGNEGEDQVQELFIV